METENVEFYATDIRRMCEGYALIHGMETQVLYDHIITLHEEPWADRWVVKDRGYHREGRKTTRTIGKGRTALRAMRNAGAR